MDDTLPSLHNSNSCDSSTTPMVSGNILDIKNEHLQAASSRHEKREEMLMVDPSLVSGTVGNVLPVNLMLPDGTVVGQLKIDSAPNGNIDLQSLQNLVSTRILVNLQSDDVETNASQLLLNTTGLKLDHNVQSLPQVLVSNVGTQLFATGALVTTEPYVTERAELHSESQTQLSDKNSDKSPKKHRGGWPKGKKRKPEKISFAPKAPASAYCLYTSTRRPKIREENPTLTFAEQVKIMGREWSNLSDMEKQKYFDMASEDKKRYVTELKKYQDSDTFHEAMASKNKGENVGCTNTKIDIDEILHCNVCDMYFTNHHNKAEHMLGAKHLNNITKVYEEDMRKKKEKDREENPLRLDMNPDSDKVIHVHINSPPDSSNQECEPPDISGFMLKFMQKHHEREQELEHLKASVEESHSVNGVLLQKYHEHKAVQDVLETEWSTLRTYGAALSAQIDVLHMVPALFGVNITQSI